MNKVYGLEHAGICVTDMEKSLDFYVNTLGLELLDDQTLEGEVAEMLACQKGAKVRIVILGHRMIGKLELMQFVPTGSCEKKESQLTDAGRLVEVALRVKGLDDVLNKIKKSGYLCHLEPMDIHMGNLGKAKVAYVRDPDHILVELIEAVRVEAS